MDKKTDKDSAVRDLYQDRRDLYHPMERRWLILSFLGAVVFGMVSGVIGDLLAKTYLYEYFFGIDGFYATFPVNTNISPRGSLFPPQPLLPESGNEEGSGIDKIVQEYSQSLVKIFPPKESSSDLLKSAYLPAELLGMGVILTSDGWIVSTSAVIPHEMKEIVVFDYQGRSYEVSAFVRDSATPLVFFKILASNLPVIPFGESEIVKIGTEVLTFDGFSSLVYSRVKQTDYSEAYGDWRSFVYLSERFAWNFLLDSIVAQGAPVLNNNGEFIGITYEHDLFGEGRMSQVVPIHYFKSILSDLFKTGTIQRPRLGIQYMDLAHIALSSGALKRLKLPPELHRGALIYKDGGNEGYEGVLAESPAFLAKFLPNDILLKVNDEILDSDTTLSDLVLQYQKGDEINITFLREGIERTAKVTLDEISSLEQSKGQESLPKEEVKKKKK